MNDPNLPGAPDLYISDSSGSTVTIAQRVDLRVDLALLEAARECLFGAEATVPWPGVARAALARAAGWPDSAVAYAARARNAAIRPGGEGGHA
jgi:hypothetical protein